MTKIGFGDVKGAQRIFLFGMMVWLLLQVSRFIALSLLDQIGTGGDSEAWRYPAYLDLFAAVLALPLIWMMIARRGLVSWALLVIYWSISIVDHVGNFVTTTYVGPPSIADGMNPYFIPVIQTLFDVVFLILLFVPKFRSLFFRLQKSET